MADTEGVRWLLGANKENHAFDHAFNVALRVKGRRLIARRRVRGVYRKKGTGFNAAHVKPGRKLRLPTVAKNVLIGGGLGGGKMLVWRSYREQLGRRRSGQVLQGGRGQLCANNIQARGSLSSWRTTTRQATIPMQASRQRKMGKWSR